MNNGVKDISSYNNLQQNFIAMFAQYTNIQNVVVNEAYALCDNITDLLYMSLYIILTISFLFIFIIFPIYYSIQHQREQILKLNSTFDPNKLEQIIISVDNLLEQGNILKQKHKRRNNNNDNSQTNIPFLIKKNQQQQQAKKKMISQTTTLSKMNGVLIFVAVIVLLLLTIYPVVNLVVITNFINEAKLCIKELSSLYSVRAQLTSNYAANYMAISGALIEGPLDETKYKRVHSLASTNQSKLQEILSILDDFKTNRYDEASYEGFFLTILKQNICDAFQQYPEYINTQYQIDNKECREMSNNLLENGLYVSLKYVFSKFEEILPFFDKKSVSEFKINMQLWANKFDFFEFNKLYRMLIKVIESLRIFMIIITQNYYGFVKKISYGLFLFSIACLLLIFYFCWFKFLRQISDSISQTRKILTVVSVGFVIENPYIMSFLNKENKK